jgi:hypothetical protein
MAMTTAVDTTDRMVVGMVTATMTAMKMIHMVAQRDTSAPRPEHWCRLM